MRKEFIDKLSEILVEMNILKVEDLFAIHKEFQSRADISFEDFLLEEGLVDRSDLLQALSRYYEVPAIDVVGEIFDHHDVRLIPEEVMVKHFFIPYKRENDNLTVVAANPGDPHLPVVIGKYVTHNIEFAVGLAQDIIDTVREYYDKSITYQPNSIQASPMERSQQEVHPLEDRIVQEDHNEEIPLIIEETIDDYEGK